MVQIIKVATVIASVVASVICDIPVNSYQSYQLGPPDYQFKWNVLDHYSGNDFGQEEARTGYNTDGEYSVLLPDGRKQIVTYNVADAYSGYVADVRYEGEAKYVEAPHPIQPAYKPQPAYRPAPAPYVAPAPYIPPVHAPKPKPIVSYTTPKPYIQPTAAPYIAPAPAPYVARPVYTPAPHYRTYNYKPVVATTPAPVTTPAPAPLTTSAPATTTEHPGPIYKKSKSQYPSNRIGTASAVGGGLFYGDLKGVQRHTKKTKDN